jgi:protein SCO1/2
VRRIAAALGVCALGALVLATATDGLRAFTAEAARRLAAERSPRLVPDAQLVDQAGRRVSLHALPGERLYVEFVFTRCASVCGAMARAFARAARGAPEEVRFVSITLDPEHDTLPRLREHARRVGADGERWRFARVDDASELRALLDRLGVVVIPHPQLLFEHNAAIHELDAGRRLVAIHDVEALGGRPVGSG